MTEEVMITVAERDALYEYLLSHLSGLDDLRIAFEREDFVVAARLSVEFGDELRLMEDIGWGRLEVASPIAVTMSAPQRRRLFTNLRAGVELLRRDEEREETEIDDDHREKRERATRITEACDRILDGN